MKTVAIRKIAPSSRKARVTRTQVAEVARAIRAAARSRPVGAKVRIRVYRSAPKLHK